MESLLVDKGGCGGGKIVRKKGVGWGVMVANGGGRGGGWWSAG